MKSLITVAIPLYNGAKFIVECLESLKAQSRLEECEILIVDDQSTDSSFVIVSDFIKRNQLHGKWRVEQNKTNLGLVGNWNRCCLSAEGEWIMFLFQDDFLEPDAIQHRINLLQTYPYSIFISDRNYVYELPTETSRKDFYETQLKRLSDYYFKPAYLYKEDVAKLLIENFLGQNFIGEPVVGIFKKDLLNKYGYFDLDLKQICDLELWLRMGLNEGLFFDPKKIVNFRIHDNSASKRNSLNKVTVSRVDRVKLGYKFLTKEYYSELRLWYAKQQFTNSFDELYTIWCFENLPLNRHLLSYKKVIDNTKFKMDMRFVFRKLKLRLMASKK
jgi:glycosyltransferase involved in cell wall biosynthesis